MEKQEEKAETEFYTKEETQNNAENTKEKMYQREMHGRDVNSRMIFKNPILTCQFLKDYTGIPLFAQIQPEDIEDVTERYRAFLGVEFESDTVKKIQIKSEGKEGEIYVVSLIEHKSYVDYDVAMQLLCYMALIWRDYKIEQDRKNPKSSEKKSFRYPLIVPIVYYEGKRNWTADMHLRDRIQFGDQMAEYLPDFQYKVIRIHDYTNEELQKKQDEMSLVMMINKIQTAEDFQDFLKTTKSFIHTVYQHASDDIQRIYMEIADRE